MRTTAAPRFGKAGILLIFAAISFVIGLYAGSSPAARACYAGSLANHLVDWPTFTDNGAGKADISTLWDCQWLINDLDPADPATIGWRVQVDQQDPTTLNVLVVYDSAWINTGSIGCNNPYTRTDVSFSEGPFAKCNALNQEFIYWVDHFGGYGSWDPVNHKWSSVGKAESASVSPANCN